MAVVKRDLLVQEKEGLHLRPAAQLVRTAAQFKSDLTLRYGGRSVNGKSMLQVMSLCVQPQAVLHAEFSGPDADVAAEAVQSLFGKEQGSAGQTTWDAPQLDSAMTA